MIRRDPVILSLIVLVPAIQIILFGYAIRPFQGDVRIVLARSEKEPAVAKTFTEGGFVVTADGLSRAEAERRVRSQEALLGVYIPDPTGSKTEATERTPAIFVDDSNPAQAYPALDRLKALYWQQIVSGEPQNEIAIQLLYNPQRRSDWVLTPGLSGVIVMISMLMLGALAIVRERERGTWEAILSTPCRGFEVILGKALPYLISGMLQTVVVIGVCSWLFHLPLRGSWPGFLFFELTFILTHLLIGLTISAAAISQLQAVQGAVLIYLPSMLLSGFIFPLEQMPSWAQALGGCFPLTYYVRAILGFMLRGVDSHYLYGQTIPVLMIGGIAFVFAVVVIRKRL